MFSVGYTRRRRPVMPEGRKIRSEATIFSAYPVSRADGWRWLVGACAFNAGDAG